MEGKFRALALDTFYFIFNKLLVITYIVTCTAQVDSTFCNSLVALWRFFVVILVLICR